MAFFSYRVSGAQGVGDGQNVQFRPIAGEPQGEGPVAVRIGFDNLGNSGRVCR
jgi:hypothetical protein